MGTLAIDSKGAAFFEHPEHPHPMTPKAFAPDFTSSIGF
jgi:hypothetical protein